MDKLIEQIILQAPTVAVLVFIVREQERRMNELMNSVLECLNSKKNSKKDSTYTYPE